MKALVGVDIGTQGTKTVVFDASGRCLAQAFESSRLVRPAPGVVEEDPERQVASVCATIKKCIALAHLGRGDVAAIGIDGQMAGILGVGRDGRHVTPYDSWLDTRCGPYIKKMDEAAGQRIAAQAGCPPSFNHGPKILWWVHERKRIYRTIHAFVQPGGYAAMRLCGLDGTAAFIDHTYLHFSAFADNPSAVWDGELCRLCGVDAAKLPRIVEPQTLVGELTAPAARRCGLTSGVPVVAGCGDTVASFMACGAVEEGIGVDVAGTAAVFAATTASFRPDVERRMLACGRSAVAGLWHPYAYINGGGLNLEWFRRELANAGRETGGGKTGTGSRYSKEGARNLHFTRVPVPVLSLADLDKQAADLEPGDSLPLFIPHLGGRVCPAQPDLRGAWIGLAWDHGLAHLYRAVLEGVALEYALYQQSLGRLYEEKVPGTSFEKVPSRGKDSDPKKVPGTSSPVKELRVTGGGESSDLWNAIKADALQTPLRRVARPEGAPLGAAMLAGWGVGLLPSLPQAAKQWISLGKTTRPRKQLAEFSARRLKRYESLLKLLDPECVRIS